MSTKTGHVSDGGDAHVKASEQQKNARQLRSLSSHATRTIVTLSDLDDAGIPPAWRRDVAEECAAIYAIHESGQFGRARQRAQEAARVMAAAIGDELGPPKLEDPRELASRVWDRR